MKPQLLTLALDTPLENLLDLPNGVELAYSLRSELERYSPAQLRDIVAAIDTLIATERKTIRSIPGFDDGEIHSARELNRDIDWLGDAIQFQPLPRLHDETPIGAEDLYRVLALYKLGAVIDATQGCDNSGFDKAVVEDILEATKAMTLARSPIETWEQALEKAWHGGIRPDPSLSVELQNERSKAAKKAADSRHAKNREIKQRALDIYFKEDFQNIEDAIKVISKLVSRAPTTVRDWLYEARRERGLTRK